MRFLTPILGLLTLLVPFIAADENSELAQLPFSAFQPSDYINSTGLTNDVQWDGYSLFIKGQRIYLYSGEIHNSRVPNPEFYLDIMQRLKAIGFNAISHYPLWGLVNPSPGVFDFEGWKSLEPFLQAANDAGLWVVTRPGPYVNAEFAAGGIPFWVTGLPGVQLRTSDPVWTDAYTPYWEKIGDIINRYQITSGGPIIGVQIENEYYLDGTLSGNLDLPYVQNLENLFRSAGIKVPFTFNDNFEGDRLATGEGSVDLYAVDYYPQNTDCANNNMWRSVQTLTRPYLQNVSGPLGEPFYIPEFQGGWIPGTDTTGYNLDACLPLFSNQFERVFYLNNIAQSIKMQSVYMVYGGTNYGHTAFPRGITSYDYWAAISEDRTLKDKYYEFKLISHFVRAARDLPKTWIVQSGNMTGSSAPGVIQIDELRNPDTNAGFYVVRHANSSSLKVTSFDLDVSDWQGNTTVPVNLNGRDARIIVSNYCFGASCISHSSAAVMTSTTLGDVDFLVVYGDPGHPYEIAFPDPNCQIDQLSGSPKATTSVSNGRTVMNFTTSSGEAGVVKVTGGTREVRVVILDTQTAYFTWEAVVPASREFGSHYSIGSNETVLVIGPYFLRWASASGSTLNLQGDVNTTTTVYVAASSTYTSLTWNNMSTTPTKTSDGLWKITVSGPAASSIPSAPSITNWRWRDSLPEIEYGYDDSAWTVANKTGTLQYNQQYPDYTGKYVLYGQLYEYLVGSTIWRGKFVSTGKETGFNVSLSPGTTGAGAFFLNGEYLGSAVTQNIEGKEDVNASYIFPNGPLKAGSENYIQCVVDNAGVEGKTTYTAFSSDLLSPRGIRGYTLLGGDSGFQIKWKVQGNRGGWTDFPDKVRGYYNTGGLYGEREGWYLPGYDDSGDEWKNGGPQEKLDGPGVRFYRGTVDVDYPEGLDVHYSFVFPNVTGGYRAQLFVNGWQYGRRYGDLSHQVVFPVMPGILTQGTNTIALSFFAFNATDASLSLGGPLTLQVDQPVTTSNLELSKFAIETSTYDDIFGSNQS